MALPIPAPGLVISYAYLWHDQGLRGAEEGRKSRPCAIILTTTDQDGDTKILVAPITHAKPSDPHAVELPPAVKRRLRLDDAPSWIVTDEVNRFTWPGYDLRPIARDKPDVFAWGYLPQSIFAAVKAGILAHQRARRLKLTARDDD